MLCYITCVMVLYNMLCHITCYVKQNMLYDMCYVMLYNICYVI